MFIPVVLVPVWVNNELRFLVVPGYPLSMPPPPDIGPMKVSSYLGSAGLLTTALTKYVNEMVPNSKLRVSIKERFQYWSK